MTSTVCIIFMYGLTRFVRRTLTPYGRVCACVCVHLYLPSVVRVQSRDVALTGTPRRGTFVSI